MAELGTERIKKKTVVLIFIDPMQFAACTLHAACKWLLGQYHVAPLPKQIIYSTQNCYKNYKTVTNITKMFETRTKTDWKKQVLIKLQLQIHDLIERPCI